VSDAQTDQIRLTWPLCHFVNPDLEEGHFVNHVWIVGHTDQERVCQRRDGHPGPHAGIVGRSRWLYPTTSWPDVVNGKSAEQLIVDMDLSGV